MIRIYEISASAVLTPPAGRARIFLDTDGFIKAKLDDGSLIVLSVTPEYIQDVIGTFFGDSSTIDFTYDDSGNVATMDVIQSALDITQIPNTPSGNLSATNVQDALNELQSSIDTIGATAAEVAQDAISDAISAGTQDGISVSYNDPANSFSFTNTDKGSVAVTAHEAALDPHPQYETAAEAQAKVDAHANLTNNPHSVTKAQVGLGNVQNVDTTIAANIVNVPSGNLIASTVQAALNELQTEVDGISASATEVAQDATAAAFAAGTQDGVTVTYNDVANSLSIANVDKGSTAVTAHEAALDPHPQYETSAEAQAKVDAHANLTNNPHNVTKAQVGLGNVDNTSDINKPISTATQAALDLKYDASNPNGYETPAQLNTRDTNNRARANHTGTQLSSTISDFTEASQDSVAAAFSAGTQDGVSVTYNDVANSLSIANIDKGTIAVTAHEAAVDPHPQYLTTTEGNAAYTPISHVGSGGTQHANATTSVSGFMSAADKTKLDGIGGARIIKSGSVAAGSFTGAPRTATVTFGTAFPNTNYSIHVTGANSRSWSFQSKAAGSFVINSNANGALSGEVTWTCISYGETVE